MPKPVPAPGGTQSHESTDAPYSYHRLHWVVSFAPESPKTNTKALFQSQSFFIPQLEVTGSLLWATLGTVLMHLFSVTEGEGSGFRMLHPLLPGLCCLLKVSGQRKADHWNPSVGTRVARGSDNFGVVHKAVSRGGQWDFLTQAF